MTDKEREVFAAVLLIAPVVGTILSMILVELSARIHIKRVKRLYDLIHKKGDLNVRKLNTL